MLNKVNLLLFFFGKKTVLIILLITKVWTVEMTLQTVGPQIRVKVRRRSNIGPL